MSRLLAVELTLIVATLVVSLRYAVAATRHLARENPRTPMGVLVRGSLNRRKDFTEAGWALWVNAQVVFLVGMICALLLMVMGR